MKVLRILILVASASVSSAALAQAGQNPIGALDAAAAAMKADVRGDAYGCKAICGTRTCCIARNAAVPWDDPRVMGGHLPRPRFPYVPPRDPRCPRVDIISLSRNVSALNVNGYTFGHFRGLEINRNGSTPTPFQTGQIAFMNLPPNEDFPHQPFAPGDALRPVPGDLPQPPQRCKKDRNVPFEIDPLNKTFQIEETAVGSFKSFTFSKDVIGQLNKYERFTLPGNTQVDTSSLTGDQLTTMGYKGPVDGTVGGAGGTRLPGGPSQPPPKKICPSGRACAE